MISDLAREINVLNSNLEIEGISTDDLAKDVNALNAGHADAKTCTAVPALDGQMNVVAASALLELARASRTTRDRTIAAAHQWWGLLRE